MHVHQVALRRPGCRIPLDKYRNVTWTSRRIRTDTATTGHVFRSELLEIKLNVLDEQPIN